MSNIDSLVKIILETGMEQHPPGDCECRKAVARLAALARTGEAGKRSDGELQQIRDRLNQLAGELGENAPGSVADRVYRIAEHIHVVMGAIRRRHSAASHRGGPYE